MRLDEEILEIERLKQNNLYGEDVNKKISSLPSSESSEKDNTL